MDKFKALSGFCRVVETGSFTKAAESAGVPPSTLSGQIRALEDNLGVRLIERNTRRVNISDDGKAYYERARRILDDLREADDNLKGSVDEIVGQLRVTMQTSFARNLVIPALPKFLRKYPKLDIDFIVSDRMVDLLEENIDIAIRIGGLTDSAMIARPLGRVKLVTAASPGYIKTHGSPEHPRDLHKTQNILYKFPRSENTYPWEFAKSDEQIQFIPQGRITFDDLDAYIDAGRNGLGIIHTLDFQSATAVEKGELLPILSGWATNSPPISAFYPERRHMTARVRVFLDWISELMK